MGVRAAALKYLQVRNYLRDLVEHELEPGQPVPSERELTARFGVARMTVRQAVDALVVEGLLERVQGRGTFVAKPKIDLQVRLTGYTEEMRRRGMQPSSRTLSAEVEPADDVVAQALEMAPGEPVIHLHRQRLADGEPMAVGHVWLAERLAPGLLETGVPNSLYAELRARGVDLDWGEDAVDAVSVSAADAELLGVAPGAPGLRIVRRAFADDTAVEYSRTLYRADRYSLWVPLARPKPSVTPRRTRPSAPAD